MFHRKTHYNWQFSIAMLVITKGYIPWISRYPIHISYISYWFRIHSCTWKYIISLHPYPSPKEQSGPSPGALEQHGRRALPGLHQGPRLAGVTGCRWDAPWMEIHGKKVGHGKQQKMDHGIYVWIYIYIYIYTKYMYIYMIICEIYIYI